MDGFQDAACGVHWTNTMTTLIAETMLMAMAIVHRIIACLFVGVLILFNNKTIDILGTAVAMMPKGMAMVSNLIARRVVAGNMIRVCFPTPA